MLLATVFLFAVPSFQAESASKPVVRPLTTNDAIAVLSGVRVRVVPFGDRDGDGSPEFVAAGVEGADPTIDVYSARDGKLIRRLWKGAGAGGWGTELTWDAGGDVNEDGIPDVLIGLPLATAQDRRGAVLVVSGADGTQLQQSRGEDSSDFYGTSIAFTGDLNGDGLGDYAVGAPQADTAHYLVPWEGNSVELPDGTKRILTEDLKPGRVIAHSGRDGSALWRVEGTAPGHAFGSSLSAIGDIDGDGIGDVIAGCDRRSPQLMTLVSGRSGKVITQLQHDHGPAGPAGDFDGDGVPDLHFDTQELDSTMRGDVRVVSGANFKTIPRFPNPDWGGDFGMSVGLGDLDGDGFSELAIGEPNFHIKGPGNPGFEGTAPDLSKMSLAQTLALTSDPWSMTYESGCLLVYSGRTRSVIWGIFGHPGSMEGIGFHATAIPDVSGDGYPDLAVAGAGKTYVFPGPGKSAD